MKIRFIQTLSTTREVFRAGHDYDLQDAEATECISAGVAIAASLPVTSNTPTIAAPVRPPARQQRGSAAKASRVNDAD